MEKKLFEIKEVLEIIPMSRAGLYKAAKDSKIPTRRIGQRIFIPSWWIRELVEEKPSE